MDIMGDELFFFDPNYFLPLAQKYRTQYQQPPFPHVVINELLPDSIARRIAKEFPLPSSPSFKKPDVDNFQVNKLGLMQESYFSDVSPFLRHILAEFNSMVFLDFLEGITGIQGLIPDPHFIGGAMHQILPSGHLSIHADFNFDRRRSLQRRINVLFYLNQDWQPEYGGDLELWSEDMSRCCKSIAPALNRCVIFNTSSTSYHGHPEPLRCPAGMTRKSLAFYYYTALPKDQAIEPHSTLWQSRPGEAAQGN
jgi:Rps23 Pro-64 3,4-dihydroxylase Tpa1-like proline 4-hydroxylase